VKRITTAVIAAFVAVALLSAANAQDLASPVLRHTHYFVVMGDGGAPTIHIDTRSFYTYHEGVTVEVTDREGRLRFEGMAPLGMSIEQSIPGPPADSYLAAAEPGYNGIVFSADRPWCVFAGGRWGLGSNREVPRLYLWVPEGCAQFTVAAHAPSPGESGRIEVFDPAGAQVAGLDSTFDEREETTIDVPEAQRGAVWSLSWADPQAAEGSLDDINTWIEGELTPVLFPVADWAEQYGQMLWERHEAATGANGG